jgi:hypothetical protein
MVTFNNIFFFAIKVLHEINKIKIKKASAYRANSLNNNTHAFMGQRKLKFFPICLVDDLKRKDTFSFLHFIFM